MRKLLLALLFPFALAAQTPVTIQNPSFETGAPSGTTVSNNWNYGPVPGWNCNGTGGEFNPTSTQVQSGIAGSTTLWLNANASCSQDLGPVQANATYTLTYSVGSQVGFVAPSSYTVSLGLSGCTTSGTPPATQGALVQQTLTCTAGASGELILTLSNSASQVLFDNLSLVIPGPPPPFVWQQPGLSATFPLQLPPSCGPSDGTPCSFSLQVVMPASQCSVDPTGATMTCTGNVGTVNLLKSITLPTPQTQSVTIVTVAPQ